MDEIGRLGGLGQVLEDAANPANLAKEQPPIPLPQKQSIFLDELLAKGRYQLDLVSQTAQLFGQPDQSLDLAAKRSGMDGAQANALPSPLSSFLDRTPPGSSAPRLPKANR